MFLQKICIGIMLTATLALLFPSLGFAVDCVLVEDDVPTATIVLAEQPSSSAQIAAKELNHYLKKSSGTILPITSDVFPPPPGATRVLIGESTSFGSDQVNPLLL